MSQDDPPIIFSLAPLNDGAREVLTAGQNAHLRGISPDGSTDVLSIGKFSGGESKYTLATTGRGTDAMGCTFDIHENSKEIMLQDWSTQQTTQVSCENANVIDGRGGIRHVVLDDAKPVDFGFGGPDCNVYRFRLYWHMKSAEVKLVDRPDLPHNAPTVMAHELTALPTRPTRIQSTTAQKTIRYLVREKLGGGASGQVFKVADVDLGHHVAMKRMDRPQIQSVAYARLKAEIDFLSRASHENVVKFLGYQWDATFVEIFTELMSGTVDNLMIQNFYSDHSPRVDTIPDTGPDTHVSSLLHQTLKGLDYLLSPGGEYVYKLADFGTAHAVGTGGEVGGVGCISTEMYRAPELSQEGAKAKTGNDIWSLFVTMAVAMDTDGFRRKALYMTALRVIAVQEAADHPSMAMMSSMAKADPGERATAEEMLIKLFNGEGCAPRPKPKLPSNRVQKRKALSGALKTTAASQRREPYQTHQARRLAQQPAASETEEMREMVREAQRHNDEMDWE
ncbi:calcium/calmodulin-dependent protein kinase [Ilyonectria destructans]|nr:calcium/calmodulin-dependent protein kinase [Ilyonectria destructans]